MSREIETEKTLSSICMQTEIASRKTINYKRFHGSKVKYNGQNKPSPAFKLSRMLKQLNNWINYWACEHFKCTMHNDSLIYIENDEDLSHSKWTVNHKMEQKDSCFSIQIEMKLKVDEGKKRTWKSDFYYDWLVLSYSHNANFEQWIGERFYSKFMHASWRCARRTSFVINCCCSSRRSTAN